MAKSDNKLESHVAAPFTIKGDIHVIANVVLDTLSAVDGRMAMNGKMLEVDGTKYVSFNSLTTVVIKAFQELAGQFEISEAQQREHAEFLESLQLQVTGLEVQVKEKS